MWCCIYPTLVDHALALVDDTDSEIQHNIVRLNEQLKKLVEYELKDEKSLSILLKTIRPHLANKLIATKDMTMDWLILLLHKQPQSLFKASDEILSSLAKTLPDLSESVRA
jgi:hypothetical protein